MEKAAIQDYGVYLKDKHRPPSRGGNKRAWHQHVMTIEGERYSFLAPWSGKLAYKMETVSFDWDWDATEKYRNIDAASVVAWKADGSKVIRGQRGGKVWRTAATRPPARRSEWKD